MTSEFKKEMQEKMTRFDIRIVGVSGTKYVIKINPGKNITLEGQGIENKGNCYRVTDKALDKIQKQYKTVTDF